MENIKQKYYKKEEVINFINSFSRKYDPILKKYVQSKDIIECFTRGRCYYFAKILQDRFNGVIMYDKVMNHFVCAILLYDDKHSYMDNIWMSNGLFDITGMLEEDRRKDFERWNTFMDKCMDNGEYKLVKSIIDGSIK